MKENESSIIVWMHVNSLFSTDRTNNSSAKGLEEIQQDLHIYLFSLTVSLFKMFCSIWTENRFWFRIINPYY